MFSANDLAIHTPTDQVSVTVVRKSDGQSLTFVLDEKTLIHDLKHELRRRLKPRFDQGCRLIFRNKVLKGKHTLKHYGIKKGVNDQAISSKSRWRRIFSEDRIFSHDSSGRYQRMEIIILIIFGHR